MVILSSIAMIAYAPVVYTFGVFLQPLTEQFGWDRGALSGAFSIQMLLIGVISIFIGRLNDKYGPRIFVTLGGLLTSIGFLLMSQVNSLWQVYLNWGFIMGIGGGFFYIAIISTVPKWFVKRAGAAIGITVAGMGLGAVISPPIIQWLISIYGWQQPFIILSIVLFVIVVPLAQFMHHSPQRMGIRPYGDAEDTIWDKLPLLSTTEGISFNQAVKTSRFWFFGLVVFCACFCIQVIIVHIVPYAIDVGVPAIVAAGVLSIAAGSSVVGRLTVGLVADRIGGRLALSFCVILITLSLICLLFIHDVWMFYAFAVVFGFGYGGVLVLTTIVTAELYGLTSLGMMLGIFSFYDTGGGVLGPPLAGSIFDATRSYNLAFVICIVLGVLAIILSLSLLKAKSWRDSSQTTI
jgi:MFS family permease